MTSDTRTGAPATPGHDAVLRQGWRATWLLLGFMLVNFADKAVLGLAATPIMEEMDLTRSEFGAASTAFFALFSLSALLGSFLTRRMRTTTLLLIMALLWSAAQLPMVANVGFGVLVATRLLLGAAEGPAAPVAFHHLFGWFGPRERQLPLAIVNVGAVAGVVVAGPVLSVVIDQFGWRAAFGTVGVIGLVWAAVWARLGREGPDSGLTGRAEGTGKADGAGELRTDGPPDVPYRRIILCGTWLASAFVAFAVYWHLASFLTWTADYLQSVSGLSTQQAGYAVGGEAAAAGALVIGFAFLTRRLQQAGRTRVAELWCAALLLVSAVGTALFGVVDPVALKLVLLIGLMPAGAVALVAAEAAVGRIAPAARRGVSLGALSFVFSLAGGLAPWTVGTVVDAAASPAAGYRDGYLLSAGLLVVAAVVSLVWLRPERDVVRLAHP
ncbi:MFS transporter [Streptomyces sp. NPDC017979]|uniref:MFS transporter n=1 Tax=Streptomyces sp. NPDC017979 TaxID=3365024 RepID=UPI00378F84FF